MSLYIIMTSTRIASSDFTEHPTPLPRKQVREDWPSLRKVCKHCAEPGVSQLKRALLWSERLEDSFPLLVWVRRQVITRLNDYLV